MSNYTSDRNFTDFVFKQIAIPTIYEKLGWKNFNINEEELNQLDLHKGIDAVALDEKNEKITIQYRFREEKYLNFNDVTLRYKRPNNAYLERRDSEFFKIEADFFIYGIVNDTKASKEVENRKLLKWAVIDLKKLMSAIDNKDIVIDNTIKYRCKWDNNKMYCPINNNWDGSSNFVPFDVNIIFNYLSDKGIIVAFYGYQNT